MISRACEFLLSKRSCRNVTMDEVASDLGISKRTLYENFENKLTEALDFQDTIQDIINIDVPRITTIRTINGVVLPLRNIKVI